MCVTNSTAGIATTSITTVTLGPSSSPQDSSRKNRNRATTNASDDIDLETSVPSDPIITPMLTTSTRTRAGSIKSLTSKPAALPITLSWSSRHVYEEEIEQLREENSSQRNQIRYMDGQMDEQTESACRGSPPPPSYRSRMSLSEISDPFDSSPSPPPLPPLPSPMM
ncbi:uncharacterized protein EV420DRAFT_1478730 [Desarmillaria tabescens]|uniref:Uncharacterized protein n=1 Tax=Armillaria tabescens TaxID=1929756 RepID=A0AA39KG69_ARMTA|nr:uncharacterized protein EV420DRAFT_1478730 [Desarmillaria tabescens]KAK0460208.1 hypothetical protein EV420DRAFT_1478730 [Desarmillaria tabescens]